MTVLITGANRGIGLALTEHYVASGQKVVGTYRKAPHPKSAGVDWQMLEIKDPKSHEALVKRLDGRAIDLLVCNAGVYYDKGENIATGFPPEDWAETFAVNVSGVFMTIRNLLPNVKAAKGKIAIISSAMGSNMRANGGSYIYRASKAAVINLARNLATDLRGEKIAVGVYHPGWVRTDMGGSDADIDTSQSADGLLKRFAALGMETTGCFEYWDGRTVPF